MLNFFSYVVVLILLWCIETVLAGVSSAIFFVPGFLLFIPGGKLIIWFPELLFTFPWACTSKWMPCFVDINNMIPCISSSVPCDIHQLCCPRKKRLQIVLSTLFWKMTFYELTPHVNYISLFAILRWIVFFVSHVTKDVLSHGCVFLSLLWPLLIQPLSASTMLPLYELNLLYMYTKKEGLVLHVFSMSCE